VSATSTRPGRRAPRYRRRRPLPALLVFGLLVVLSGFLWTRVFETTANTETATECNLPGVSKSPPDPQRTPTPTATPFGTMLLRNGLDQTAPVPPQNVQVRVLNANGQSRQATLISDELGTFGFAKGGPPDNDPIYTHYDLKCHGQIRFGAPGAGAARTLSLAVPCAQLVRDGRQDPAVDLALGAQFDDIKMAPEARQILQQLSNQASQQAGRAQHEVGQPPINDKLLAAARDVHC
jgi:hypothetical protein